MNVTYNGADRLTRCCPVGTQLIRVHLPGAVYEYRFCDHHRAAVVARVTTDLTRWGRPARNDAAQLTLTLEGIE